MSKETYKLMWTPSVDARAAQQKVFAVIAGEPAVELTPAPLATTDTYLFFDFDTDVVVEWFVKTLDTAGTLEVDSEHSVFTAADQTVVPLEPATGLGEQWIGHKE